MRNSRRCFLSGETWGLQKSRKVKVFEAELLYATCIKVTANAQLTLLPVGQKKTLMNAALVSLVDIGPIWP